MVLVAACDLHRDLFETSAQAQKESTVVGGRNIVSGTRKYCEITQTDLNLVDRLRALYDKILGIFCSDIEKCLTALETDLGHQGKGE